MKNEIEGLKGFYRLEDKTLTLDLSIGDENKVWITWIKQNGQTEREFQGIGDVVYENGVPFLEMYEGWHSYKLSAGKKTLIYKVELYSVLAMPSEIGIRDDRTGRFVILKKIG